MVALHGFYQDAQPSMIIQLWKANLEEPNFDQPDPAAIIYDSSKSKFSNLLSIMIVYVNAVWLMINWLICVVGMGQRSGIRAFNWII